MALMPPWSVVGARGDMVRFRGFVKAWGTRTQQRHVHGLTARSLAMLASTSLIAGLLGLAAATPAQAVISGLTAAPASVTAEVGDAVSVAFTPAFVVDPATGTVSYGSDAPAWLTLTPNADPTLGATLTGTAPAAGSVTVNVTATDSGATADPIDDVSVIGSVSITVNAPSLNPSVQPAITGVVGLGFTTATIQHPGFTTPVFSISPAPPAGWAFSTTTGVLSGTPTAAAPDVIYTITATEGANTATSTVVIGVPAAAIAPPTPTVTATVGAALAPPVAFTHTGFAAAPAFAISPALPTGLALSPAGVLAGTPTVASPARQYTVTATDTGVGSTSTATATVTLSAAATPLAVRVITATIGTTITATTAPTALELSTAGLVSPVTYAVSPALPAGLLLNATTGSVSGKPTVLVPTTAFTVTATDANLSTSAFALEITVGTTQLLPPVVYLAQNGATLGSMRALFIAPTNAPLGQVYAAEVYDATGATLVKTVRPFTSLTEITGLTPGATYTIVIVADASTGYLESRSVGKTGTATLTGGKLTAPVITAISGGTTAGSLVVSFSPSPNAPVGQTYTAQVYDEDQTTLVKELNRVTSPVQITGLTPGTTYFVLIAADATTNYLESLSRGRTAVATPVRTATTATPTATTTTTQRPSPATTATAVQLGAGWVRPTAAQAAKAKVVIVKVRPAASIKKAPKVTVARNKVVSLRLKKMAASALYIADVRLNGTWVNLGSARASTTGVLLTPAFLAGKKGRYTLRLTSIGQPATYLTIVVKAKR